jgi:hypothetical protein
LGDFDQIIPFLREYLPFGDAILSDETIAKGRPNRIATFREKCAMSLNQSLPTALEIGTKLKEIQLFPPGSCIHLYRDGISWQGNFVPCVSFDEIEAVSQMLDDHLLDMGYYLALLVFMRNLKKDHHWNFEHDIMDLAWIRNAYKSR